MYEALLEEAREQGLTVIERYPFTSPRIRGLCCDDTIALSAQIETEAERTVVLCEEITHAARSAGDILRDPRMERRAREHSIDRLIGLSGLVHACLAGCREPWEFAEWLGVPQDYFVEAVENYRARFGVRTRVTVREGSFALTLLPTLRVRRLVRETRNRKLNSRRSGEGNE